MTPPSPTQHEVLTALRAIPDPATEKNVVDAQRIQGLSIQKGHIRFVIEAPSPEGYEDVRKACETAVKNLHGVQKTTIVLTATSPKPTQKTPQTPQKPPGVKTVIGVASGKGGVGKSTLAVNLAAAFLAMGKTAAIMDADIYGPSIPRLLGLWEKPQTQEEKRLLPLNAHGLKTMSIGFMVEKDAPLVWRGPMAQSAMSQMIMRTDWGDTDFLVVDLPPGTGDIQLTLAQQICVAGIVLISTPQKIALDDVRRAAAMFKKTKIPLLGVVENMAWLETPQGRIYPFGQGGARLFAQEKNIPFLGEIPLEPEVAILEGSPILIKAPKSPIAQAFGDIAQALIKHLSARSPQS